MVIRVYISGNSGNKEICTHQQRIFMILNSLGIPNEPVDISAPGMEKERDFMREKCKKLEGQRHALPPQIFNGEEYRGNFEDFDIANEDDVLEEFLGIHKKDPNATEPPATTTADQPDKSKTEASTDKLGEEAMVTEECDKIEPVEAAPVQPEEPVSPVKEKEPDHVTFADEPAKPEGELIPLVETVIPPTPEPEPEPEVVVQEEEPETELIDGAIINVDEEEEEKKRGPRKSRTQQPAEELGIMWAPYQSRMVTQKGKVISTPKLILF